MVSISTSVVDTHGLDVGDQISLDVNPNLSVGIGTSTSIRVQLKNEKLVINPIGFNSTGINSTTNEITITNHGLETGDKVFYEDNTFDLWIETSDQLDTTAENDNPNAIHFKPDGTRMYIVGRSVDEVNEYILSTPWSISTASFVSNFMFHQKVQIPEVFILEMMDLSSGHVKAIPIKSISIQCLLHGILAQQVMIT